MKIRVITAEVFAAHDEGACQRSAKLEKELTEAKAAATAATAKVEELKAGKEATLATFAYEEQMKGMNAAQLADEFVPGFASNLPRRQPRSRATRTTTRRPSQQSPKRGRSWKPSRSRRFRRRRRRKPDFCRWNRPMRQLFAVQQYLAARVRTTDERAEKTTAIVAAMDDLENKAKGYAKTLDEARQTAVQLVAVAAEIERRVGRGDLDPAKVPEGVAEAAGSTGAAAKLSTDAAALQKALTELRAERDSLRKPDAEADNLKTLTASLLAKVSERIDLLTDLKKLAADYATARKDRSDAEQRRLDQRATERRTQEAGRWDWFFALDHSQPANDLSGLLDAYYKELIDLDEKTDNLRRQKESLERLVELTRKESDDIGKLRAVLSKPVEVNATDAPKITDAKIDAEKLRAQLARVEAARQWDAWLANRVAPTGLRTEASLYHDEFARARRVERSERPGAFNRSLATHLLSPGRSAPTRPSNRPTAERLARLAANCSTPTSAAGRSPASRSGLCCSRRSSSRGW